MISFYIVLVIFFEAVLDKGTSTSVGEGFSDGHDRVEIKAAGVFNCLPLIIFSYMYQINIPGIYTELSDKSMKSMTKVLVLGTASATVAYVIAGIFGFIAFTGNLGDKEYRDLFEE